MKYGVFLPNFGAFGYALTLASLARDAEQAGWDGFFIWGHITRSVPLPNVDPWVAMTAIALQTKTIQFGPIVTPLPRRRPWKVARESVSIEHLAKGRLALGVGIGSGGLNEWYNLGEETDPRARGRMLDEALDVLAGLWQGEPVSYDGQYYKVKFAHFVPKPLHAPRIPIWIAGEWPNRAPFRRAARWDGMIPLLKSADDRLNQFKAVVAYTREHRRDSSRFEIVLIGTPTPGDNPEQATELIEQFRLAGATWWLEPISPVRFGVGWADEWPFERLRERIVQGPPKT